VKRALAVYGSLFLLGGVLAAMQPPEPKIALPEHRRGEEQTFLTYPEWFLVFSPDEYAQFVKRDDPSAFPFLGHVRQFWESYAAVIGEQRRHPDYAANGEYHGMIIVIGVSTTLEYGLRSAYETFIGRLAESTATRPTPEDLHGSRVAQEYVDFIKIRPWYEFDFASRLKTLWTQTPLSSGGVIRGLERRYALTTEYLVKAGYGWLLAKAANPGEDKPLTVTHVAYRRGANLESALLPRYGEFTPQSTRLAVEGADFVEIAGNGARADMLVSVLVPAGWQPPINTRTLFEQPLLTVPGRKRVAFAVEVGTLAELLRSLHANHVEIEHVFDY
jgi:hypothetical protein